MLKNKLLWLFLPIGLLLFSYFIDLNSGGEIWYGLTSYIFNAAIILWLMSYPYCWLISYYEENKTVLFVVKLIAFLTLLCPTLFVYEASFGFSIHLFFIEDRKFKYFIRQMEIKAFVYTQVMMFLFFVLSYFTRSRHRIDKT